MIQTKTPSHPSVKSVNRLQPGYSLIELMVVTTIIAIITVVSLFFSTGMINRNALVNEVRALKTSFIKARAEAIRNKAPVRFTYNSADRSILAEMDMNRTGQFVDPVIVVQHPVPGSRPNRLPVSMGVDDPPTHPSELPIPMPPFPDNTFLILPDGRILSGPNNTPGSGTFLFDVADQDYRAAVHISAKGEVKIAFKYGATSPWDWVE